MKMQSIKTNVVINFIRTGLSILFPLVTFPYISRILMPEGIGKINFAGTYIGYFIILATFGISSYGLRIVAQNRENKEELSKVVHELFIINISATIIAYLLMFSTIYLNKQLYEIKNILLIYSLMILFTTIGFEWIYSGLEQYLFITIRSLVFQIISLVLLFCFVKTKEDIYNYILITVFSSVGSNILNFIFIKKYINIKIYNNYNFYRHIKPITIFFGMAVLANIFSKLENIILGIVSDYKTVGLFSSANKIIIIVFTILSSMNNIFVTRFSFYLKNKKKDEYDKALIDSLYIIFIISVPIIFGMEILAKEIVLIVLGEKFIEIISIFRILTPTILISLLSTFLANQVLYTNEQDKKIFKGILIGSIISMGLNILLIPILKDYGAAFSLLVSGVAVTVVLYILAKKYINIKIEIKEIVKIVFAAVIMTGVIIIIKLILINNYLLILILSFLLGSITYSISMVLLKEKIIFRIINKHKNNGGIK